MICDFRKFVQMIFVEAIRGRNCLVVEWQYDNNQ